MKQFIDNKKTYSLAEANEFMSMLNEPGTAYNNLDENEKATSSKSKTYISAMLITGILSSTNLALSQKPNTDGTDYLIDIVSIDNDHHQYVKFLESQTNLGDEKRNMLTEQILSFKSLSNNWDGYGAIPTEVKSASNAITLIQNLSPSIVGKVSSVHPTTNGTVAIVWENQDNERISFEIGYKNYSFYTKLNNLKPLFFEGFVEDEDLKEALEKEVKKL